MTKRSPFKYFKTSPEIIRLAVMLYVRFPLSLRSVEDLARTSAGSMSATRLYAVSSRAIRRLEIEVSTKPAREGKLPGDPAANE